MTHHADSSKDINRGGSFRPLLMSVLAYGIFSGAIYWTFSIDGKYSFVVLKAVAQLASLVAFLGIGIEVDYFLHGSQGKILCWVKGLSHSIALAAVLWAAYRLMPIERMMVL